LFDAAPPLLFFLFVALFFGFFASIIFLTFRGLTTFSFGSLEDGAWQGPTPTDLALQLHLKHKLILMCCKYN
jgi:hypothetical protein